MKVISLSHDANGTACSIGQAIKTYFYNNSKQTDFFDFLNISMKSVNEVLIGKEITDFKKRSDISINAYEFNNFDKIISCHDFDDFRKKDPSMSEKQILINLKQKYDRRRLRLLEVINSDESIYFLRYCTSYENIEQNEIISFMNNIKNINKNLNFHLILITTNYRQHKTNTPLNLLKLFSNIHMLYLDNYISSEQNKLNHFQLINQELYNKFVDNLKPIYNFVHNLENKVNKNAIVILTRGYDDIEKYFSLIQRNKAISQNLKDKTTDILIFNEGNISSFQKEYINQQTPELNIKFITITNKAFLKQNERFQFYEPTRRDVWNYGYRHMCHFWFIDFLDFCDEYDYILRIDEDCFVDFEIDDIFKLLPSKILIAGAIEKDIDIVTHGLNNFTINFLMKHKIKKYPNNEISGPYTNVFGLNLLRVRKNSLLRDYMNEVNKSNNIYIYRWGDLPLWGEVIKYFYNKTDFLIYNKINYYHGSLNTYVNNLTKNVKNMIVTKKKFERIRLLKKNNVNNKNFPQQENIKHFLFNFLK
jgi:hypothetical protein